jgi:hypothetical protein
MHLLSSLVPPSAKDARMFISLINSRSNGFKKWSDRHLPAGKEANQPGSATSSSPLAGPPISDPEEMTHPDELPGSE